MVYDVIGLGIASWDLIGVVSHEPMMGAKQPLASWGEVGGGPVPNALVTLARFGMQSCMISAVGTDTYGTRIIEDLQHEGVAVQIERCPGGSHIAFVLVEPDTERRTVWWHNDPMVLRAIAPERDLITAARALLLDTHLPEVAYQAASWMQAAGGLVMIDAERYKESTARLLPLCDAIIVSERFGREATGTDDPRYAAEMLFGQHGGIVVITLGERGSWCVCGDETFHTPAFPVSVVDTTGAGDVFHGAFLYGLLQGWDVREVARFASATAALKCRATGGRAAIPTREEVAAMLAE